MKFLNNFKKPKGKLGDKIINQMNEKNAHVADWGLNHFKINESDIVMDIGCGGGVNVEKMTKQIDSGRVYGVDYSHKAVEKSKELLINNKKAEIIQADVIDLPFDDKTFDIVTAIKTVFFWPDLNHCFDEIKRVLKDDGIFVIIADYNGNGGRFMKLGEKLLEMDAKNDIEITNILMSCNYTQITTYIRDISSKKEIVKLNNVKKEIFEDNFTSNASPSDKMGEWVCIVAKK